MNRRTFIKKISSVAVLCPLLALLPFSKGEAGVNIPEIELWDDLSIPKYDPWFYYEYEGSHWSVLNRDLKTIREKSNFTVRPKLIVAKQGNDFIKSPCVFPHRYHTVELLKLGIDDILFKGIPVISVNDARKLHKLRMLGKRIYIEDLCHLT